MIVWGIPTFRKYLNFGETGGEPNKGIHNTCSLGDIACFHRY
jgi:hypothetical protein